MAAGEAERSAEKNKGGNFGDGPMGKVCGFGGVGAEDVGKVEAER